SQQSSAPTTSTGMERRAISELIAEVEQGLRDTHTHIEEVQQVIARRRAVGADLAETLKLLENLESIARLRQRRLCYLRDLAALRAHREGTESASIAKRP